GSGAARLRCRQRHHRRAVRAGDPRARRRLHLRARAAFGGLRRLRPARAGVDRPDHRRAADGVAAVSLQALVDEILLTARGVVAAVAPLALLFAVFQVFVLRLPRREVARIVTGTLIASLGLFLFLVGVGVGFLPFGRAIGAAIGGLSPKWLLVPFGLLLGF